MLSKIPAGMLTCLLVAATLVGCGGRDQTAKQQPGTTENSVNDKTAKQQPETMESPVTEPKTNPIVTIETSHGTIKAELWPDKAPKTVANFLSYTDKKHYDGLIFHRVMAGFMIQGGGMDAKMREKATDDPIPNEASKDVLNARGTLAMARTSNPHSATSQFFINLDDNGFLNRGQAADGWGYCAFGKVIEGMDVIDAIAKVKTNTVGGHEKVPVEPVTIRAIRRAE